MYVVVAWEAGSRHYNHANSNSRSARNSQEACACTRNLRQTRHEKFARWTCLLTRKCTVHTCIYAQENNARGRGHLWLNATRTRVIYGYASVRASSDTSFMGISKQLAKKRREHEATCGRQREVPFMAHHGKRTNSRNKRRSQGRPNEKWPARTLSKYAETHINTSKG